MCTDLGLSLMPWGVLSQGLLSGKYGRNRRPDAGRLIQNANYSKRYEPEWMTQTAADFTDYAADKGVNPVTLAVQWVMSNPAITAPIIGARSVEQLTPALAAADGALSPEERAAISALSMTPPPATDRLEEAPGA